MIINDVEWTFRLLTEVRGAVGNRRDLVYEDVEKLQYTGQVGPGVLLCTCSSLLTVELQVIEETLRLHGPVGGVTKDTPDEGIVLSDCFIPGGITVTVRPNT